MYGGIQEYIHRIGRTARIGHQGLATSFFNERNEELGQDLVNVLVECDCDVPEFLSHLVPGDGKVMIDDESDNEADGEGEGAATNGGGEVADAEPGDTGFQADAGFEADDAGGAAVGAGW